MSKQKLEKEDPYWKGKHYAYFQNRECEFFPCHEGADSEDFSCIFCYCPLYAFGENCKGNFTYTEKGIKDCSGCQIPHKRNNYGYVTECFQEIAELAKIRLIP